MLVYLVYFLFHCIFIFCAKSALSVFHIIFPTKKCFYYLLSPRLFTSYCNPCKNAWKSLPLFTNPFVCICALRRAPFIWTPVSGYMQRELKRVNYTTKQTRAPPQLQLQLDCWPFRQCKQTDLTTCGRIWAARRIRGNVKQCYVSICFCCYTNRLLLLTVLFL